MTELTLPADRVAQQSDGSWLITMPGWCSVHDRPQEAVDTCTGWSNHVKCRFVPPAELVALTEPCKTCDGEGYKYRDQYGQMYGHTIARSMASALTKAPCPDCHAGRQLFDLKVECRFIDDDTYCHEGDIWNSDIPLHAHDGCDDGFVLHTGLYVPGPVLPVVHADQWQSDDLIELPCIVVYADRAIYYTDDPVGRYLDAPPATQPGDFAVIAQETT